MPKIKRVELSDDEYESALDYAQSNHPFVVVRPGEGVQSRAETGWNAISKMDAQKDLVVHAPSGKVSSKVHWTTFCETNDLDGHSVDVDSVNEKRHVNQFV